MGYESLEYSVTDNVAVIRLNQPDTLNAMSQQLAEELLAALRQGEREARAILICAAGRGFCSGANLTDGRMDINDPARDIGGRLDGVFNPIIYQISRSEAPVVTAVRGPAAGVGCALAVSADIIVAGESAYFFQAFAKIGLVPDGGSTYLLTRAIGRARASEMMLLGTKVPAAKALDWGLINRVVPDEEIDSAAMEIARELAQGPKGLSYIKRIAWATMDASLETSLSNERMAQREAGRTEDFAEGVSAFREKRKAAFKGR
jgi:2-(1,2-epoxy-1,2-dihydrophenyl)acetyl-CoA isomerase